MYPSIQQIWWPTITEFSSSNTLWPASCARQLTGSTTLPNPSRQKDLDYDWVFPQDTTTKQGNSPSSPTRRLIGVTAKRAATARSEPWKIQVSQGLFVGTFHKEPCCYSTPSTYQLSHSPLTICICNPCRYLTKAHATHQMVCTSAEKACSNFCSCT